MSRPLCVALGLSLAACSSGTSGGSTTGAGSTTSGGTAARQTSTTGASSGARTSASSSGSAGGGSSGSGAGASTSAGGNGTGASASSGGSGGAFRFPATSILYQDISGAALDPGSSATIQAVQTAGGWGSGIFQIDFSMHVNYADATVPLLPFTQNSGYTLPDCDTTPFPLPPGGAIEGSSNYACDWQNNDCHLLVYQGHWLFEAYQATTGSGLADGGLSSSCVVAWDLTHDYWQPGLPYSRGDQCTSTDAAGMPVAPLLVTGAELEAGVVPHALRFILPNAEMQAGYFEHPATHAGGPKGPSPLPIYGSRWRLKSTFDMTKLPNAAAKAVAVALQKYGMFLDDGGKIPLTFDSSAQAFLGSHDLSAIQVTDFEVVAPPDPAIPLTYDCQRSSLTSTN